VTRSAKPSTKPSKAAPKTSAFVERLAKDPVSAVLALLEGADEALNAAAIKRRLTEYGADKAAAEKAWRAAQEKVRFDDHVIFAANTYRWTTTARVISPEEAVYRLSRTTDAATRTKLLAVIQSALEGGASDPPELAEARTRIADAEQRIGMLEKEIARLSTAPGRLAGKAVAAGHPPGFGGGRASSQLPGRVRVPVQPPRLSQPRHAVLPCPRACCRP
jgi:hypothetical protein